MQKCKYCGKEFIKSSNRQIYCSKECKKQVDRIRDKNRDRSKIKKCPICNKEFVSKRKANYCSMECASIANGSRIKFICYECGKEFYRKRSRKDVYKHTFCSNECKNKFKFDIQREPKPIKRICKHCKNEFYVSNSRERTQYCSIECLKNETQLNIDEEKIKEMYINDILTTREIALKLKTSKTTILRYLKKNNVKVRPDGFKNKEKIICKDGHLVKSYYERAFDNALNKFGIEHEYEPQLPFNKRYHADFKVKDVYVEIWGMLTWDKYVKNMNNKIALYKKNNAKLLSVYPEDFKNIYIKIQELKALL